MKKYKKFLFFFIAFVFSFVFSYFGGFIWANTLENGTGGFYFTKNFMLENTKDRPRIIIESGSGSHHGINSLMIENAFNRLTLNMGYNAIYSLELRLYRLAKSLKKDDIVVLPLEYIYYTLDKDEHKKAILGELSTYGKFHYNALPLYEKVRILSMLNFNQSKVTFKNAFRYFKYKLFGGKFNFDLKPDINALLASNERGDMDLAELKKAGIDLYKIDNTRGLSCQENLISTGISLNDSFKDYMKLIKQISKDTGAKFIFTYPPMAGEGCYDFSTDIGKQFKLLLSQIKEYINKEGFEIIGDPLDVYFPDDKLDAYYHLTEKARDIRTARLIQTLRPYIK